MKSGVNWKRWLRGSLGVLREFGRERDMEICVTGSGEPHGKHTIPTPDAVHFCHGGRFSSPHGPPASKT